MNSTIPAGEEKTMSDPVAWAVVSQRGVRDVCILQAVADYLARHHGCKVIPLFAQNNRFQPQDESDAGLLDAIQAFIDQTDPWLSQVADREHKVHTPEQENARLALKELRRRLGAD